MNKIIMGLILFSITSTARWMGVGAPPTFCFASPGVINDVNWTNLRLQKSLMCVNGHWVFYFRGTKYKSGFLKMPKTNCTCINKVLKRKDIQFKTVY
jgi:hypothetical protein